MSQVSFTQLGGKCHSYSSPQPYCYAQGPLGFTFLTYLTLLITAFSLKLFPLWVSIQPLITGSLPTYLSVLSQLLFLLSFFSYKNRGVLLGLFLRSPWKCLSHSYSLLWVLMTLTFLFLGLTCALSCILDISTYRPSHLMHSKLGSLQPSKIFPQTSWLMAVLYNHQTGNLAVTQVSTVSHLFSFQVNDLNNLLGFLVYRNLFQSRIQKILSLSVSLSIILAIFLFAF